MKNFQIYFILSWLTFCIVTKKDNNKDKHIQAAGILIVSSQASSGEFEVVKGAVEEHNKIRRSKGIPDLVWDDEVGKYSKSKVEYLANQNSCVMDHSAGPKLNYGENLFWGSGKKWNIQNAINSWNEEEQYYDYSTNKCQTGRVCGHYTQVVWKNSKKLGCYKAICPNDKGTIIGCNYDPPGNYVGQKPY